MFGRRALLRMGLGGAAAFAALAAPAARADSAFKRLIPLLVDLPGWEGEKAEGLTLGSGDETVTTAAREYRRGADQIHLTIVVGPAAVAALAPLAAGMNVETSEGHMLTGEVAGVKAMKSRQNADKSGAILLALGDDAMLSFSYNGLAEDEAAALLQKLDLKGVQAAAAAK